MTNEEMSLRTKRALSAALKEAMGRKPFSKISVRELTDAANLSRKTFYYYFEDIYSLLKWTFEEEAIDVVLQFDTAIDYEEAVGFVMDYVDENDYMISCAVDALGREGLKRFFFQDFIGITTDALTAAELQAGTSLDPEYKAFLANFFTEGMAGLLLDWVSDRKSERARVSHEKVTSWLMQLIAAVMAYTPPGS